MEAASGGGVRLIAQLSAMNRVSEAGATRTSGVAGTPTCGAGRAGAVVTMAASIPTGSPTGAGVSLSDLGGRRCGPTIVARIGNFRSGDFGADPVVAGVPVRTSTIAG